MGVDAKLSLNPRWGLDDIVKVLERTQKQKVKVESCHKISAGFYYFNVANRNIAVFVNALFPTGSVTELSLSSDKQGIRILRDVANVFGGVLMESDSDGNCELINGAMFEHDGLPYFVKYAIVHDGIKPDDTQAFIDSMRKWHKEVGKEEIKAIR